MFAKQHTFVLAEISVVGSLAVALKAAAGTVPRAVALITLDTYKRTHTHTPQELKFIDTPSHSPTDRHTDMSTGPLRAQEMYAFALQFVFATVTMHSTSLSSRCSQIRDIL